MEHKAVVYGSVPSKSNQKKVSDDDLISSYSQTGSVWKTAEEFGLCGQSVHERLTKLGVIKKMNLWTTSDNQILLSEYKAYKDANNLEELAQRLGRTKQFICRKAKTLGLTNPKDKHMSDSARKKLSEKAKSWIKEKGHPKGYLGHKHSEGTRAKLSVACRSAWNNPNSTFNTEDFKQKQSDNLHRRKINNDIKTFSNRGEHPFLFNGVEIIFKSSWEVEVAKKLQDLFVNGNILGWSYESKHFVFSDKKRFIRSYCPDFEVIKQDRSLLYIEVKGWKMEKSMKRITMFKERYPNVEFYLIDEKEYGKILSESNYLRGRCI